MLISSLVLFIEIIIGQCQLDISKIRPDGGFCSYFLNKNHPYQKQ